MKFSLLIHSSPYADHGSQSSLDFACTLLKSGHSLHRVFFQGEAVLHGYRDEDSAAPTCGLQWQQLAERHSIDLVICATAATQRQLQTKKLLPQYEVSGLGQLIDAAVASDRLVTFG